jgi:hypothetical protein
MSVIRPPSWVELQSVIPLETEAVGVTSVKAVTSLSAETIRRRYPQYVIQLTPSRQGMKLRDALAIAGTVIDTNSGIKTKAIA